MNNLQIQFKGLIFKNIVTAILLIFIFNNSLFSKILSNDSIYVQSLFDSSKVYYTQGNYTKAIENLQEILTLKQKSNNDYDPQYFKVYNRLGVNYYETGKLRKAIKEYDLAIKHTAVDYNKSIIQGNIATVYSLLGEYSKAISYLRNSLILLEKSNHKRKIEKIIFNFHNQAYAYFKSGKLNLALQKSLDGMQISKKNSLKIDGDTYYNCGLIYKDLDSLDKADSYFKKAIKAYEKEFSKNHYMTLIAYANYAVFCSEVGRFLESETIFNKTNKGFVKLFGYKHYYTALSLKYTGDLFYKKKNYNKALHYYQQSLIAKIHKFNDSCIYKNPANNIYPDLDLLDILKAKANALEALAMNKNKEQNLKAALLTLQLCVGFIEQLRTGYLYENSKLQLAAKEHESYLAIVEVAHSLFEITKNRAFIETAFTYAELSKYTLLRELENEEKAKGLAGIPGNLIKEEQNLKEEISYLSIQLKNEQEIPEPNKDKLEGFQQRIFQISKKLETLNERLEKSYPEYYVRKQQNKIINIKELKKNLSNNEILIEYVYTAKKLYTFFVSNNYVDFTKQTIDSSFLNSLDFYLKFQNSLHSLSYDTFRIAAYELYKNLIQPFDNKITGKNLIIIPDNKLSLISFDALVDEPYIDIESVDYRNEPYIIKKYPISYAYSATLLVNSKKHKRKKNKKILVFAPDYKEYKDSIPELPLPNKNLRNIKRYFNTKVFKSKKATEYMFKKHYDKYSILHFYTHGFENKLNPALSKMVFSNFNDTIEDGYLHAYEINNLRMNVELVVLASCFSGSGVIYQGEGVMSMGRSFLNAGSSSIVMSLWATAYKPALFELKYFYKYLAKGKRKDVALRLAKLEYLKNCEPINAHPRYWSGLVILGNQEPIVSKGYLFIRTSIFLLFIFLSILILIILKKKRKP